jgi:hypothetical protein
VRLLDEVTEAHATVALNRRFTKLSGDISTGERHRKEQAKERLWKYQNNGTNDIDGKSNVRRGPFRERGRDTYKFQYNLENCDMVYFHSLGGSLLTWLSCSPFSIAGWLTVDSGTNERPGFRDRRIQGSENVDHQCM